MSRQWKKCARRSNFARLEQERAVLELKSYRGSSKLKSQKASINYVISPRRRFRTPSGKNQHSASFCSHLHLSSLIMEKTRTISRSCFFIGAFQRRTDIIPIHFLRLPGSENAEKTVRLPHPCPFTYFLLYNKGVHDGEHLGVRAELHALVLVIVAHEHDRRQDVVGRGV